MKKKPLRGTRIWVSMTLPRDLVERIDRLAEEEVRPRAQMIRKLVLRGLEQQTAPAVHQ